MLRKLPAFISTQKLCTYTLIRHYSLIPAMSDKKPNNIGVSLGQVIDELQKFANTSLAASWDNVGLLIEPTCPKYISHILLTNDLTEDVIEEAIELNTDMIISYHPPVFLPLKSITTRTWKERIVAKCLENKIAVYSPHTAFDSIKGGVNDWLASAFNDVMDSCKPIEADDNQDNGMGRLCTLKNEIHVDEAVKLVKQHTELKFVKLARARQTSTTMLFTKYKQDHNTGINVFLFISDSFVSSIAVCAGSGASVLKDVKADLYLTGEMLHHDVLDAVHRGIHVILTDHSNSERGFLKSFAHTLSSRLNNSINVIVSKLDADPLETV